MMYLKVLFPSPTLFIIGINNMTKCIHPLIKKSLFTDDLRICVACNEFNSKKIIRFY